MPKVPDAAKRFMTRSITIDGNTLDPTMQLILAGQKLSGEEGLSAADDPETCRRNMHQFTQMLDRKRPAGRRRQRSFHSRPGRSDPRPPVPPR